jgi:hypothetical protein
MSSYKGQNKLPEMDETSSNMCKIFDKEFKMALSWKLNICQENTENNSIIYQINSRKIEAI